MEILFNFVGVLIHCSTTPATELCEHVQDTEYCEYGQRSSRVSEMDMRYHCYLCTGSIEGERSVYRSPTSVGFRVFSLSSAFGAQVERIFLPATQCGKFQQGRGTWRCDFPMTAVIRAANTKIFESPFVAQILKQFKFPDNRFDGECKCAQDQSWGISIWEITNQTAETSQS